MAKLFEQNTLGWMQTFSAAGKYPIIDNRIFGTLAEAQAFVDNANGTAIPGINIAVIKDPDPKNNGTYFVSEAAGYDNKNAGVLVKLGEGSGTISVNTFNEAQAIATEDTVGQLVYLTTEDSSTEGGPYKVGLYVVTGPSTLAKLGTSSASGEDLSSDVATLQGKVASLESSTKQHYENKNIHLPESIGSDGQILSVSEGAPKWVDKDPSYVLPVAGTNLGGVKEGGDIDIDDSGVMTVNATQLATKAVVSLGGKVGAVTLKATSSSDGDVNLSISETNELSASISGISNFSKNGHTHEIANINGLQGALDAKATTEALEAHTGNKSNPHNVTKDQVGLSNVTNDAQVKRSEMGVANGVATLNENGKVPVSQLDGAMARVFGVEKAVANEGALPPEATEGQRYYTIDTKKIYEKTSDSWSEPSDPKEDTIYNFRHSDKTGSEKRSNILYRWDGADLVEISSSIALGETSGTAYEGNKGKQNADNIAKLQSQMTTVTGTGDGSFKKYTDDEIAKLSAVYAPISLDTEVKANTAAITLLNGEEGTEGSVKFTIKGYIDAEVERANGAYDAIGSASSVKDAVDAYTVNGKAISSNPTLIASDIKLDGYTKPEEGGAVVAGDNIMQAIGKLEASITEAAGGGVLSVNGQTGAVTIAAGTADGSIVVTGGSDIVVTGWDKKADKSTVEAYTVNGIAISSNPVLDGSKIALTGYSTGDAALPINTGDTVNAAIGKLEKSLTDNESVVSESINKIKTAVGLSEALAYEAPADSNYLEGATSVKDATSKLDAAIKANETTALSKEEIESACTL